MSTYAEFWAGVEARDWDRVGCCLAEDVHATWPQSRERCRGRPALLRFLAAFPGDWHLEVVEEHGDHTGGATRIAFSSGGETVTGLTFFTLDGDGLIAAMVEFWPEPYDPPDRGGTLERY